MTLRVFLQINASQIKFHSSYLGVLLFSFGFSRLGRLGRAVAIVLWIYIPFGILISVVPVELAQPLVLARTIFFVFAFILSAILFLSGPVISDQGAGATT